MEVVTASRFQYKLLHKSFVRHASSLLYDERQQCVANVAVALCGSRCVAKVSFKNNTQQCTVVGWGSKMILLHYVSCREYCITGIICKSCLVS